VDASASSGVPSAWRTCTFDMPLRSADTISAVT